MLPPIHAFQKETTTKYAKSAKTEENNKLLDAQSSRVLIRFAHFVVKIDFK